MTDTHPSMTVAWDVPATMRDGTILRANIYSPAEDGPWPVLLARTPYSKDLSIALTVDPMRAVRAGFMVVIQDVRGCFASGGDWLPLVHEADDGYDTIAWAATLPGSSGRVGMFGASYLGFTQWAAARQPHPALTALAPTITWADPLDGMIGRGGAMEWGLQVSWSLAIAPNSLIRLYEADRPALGAALAHWMHAMDTLPTDGVRALPLASASPLHALGLTDSTPNARGDALSASSTAYAATVGTHAQIAVPTLHVGGWYDVFCGGTLRNYQEMRARHDLPTRLIVGPWVHGRFDGMVGQVDFGMAASAMMMGLRGDLMSLTIDWFKALLPAPASPLPLALADPSTPVTIFVMGTNVWRNEADWPLARARVTPYYLHSNGAANSRYGDGALSPEMPLDHITDTYLYDPNDPVPTVGGATLMSAALPSGPYDQRTVEARQDVLVYTSQPLAEALEVTGPITAHLWISSFAPDTDVVVRLVNVWPNGFAQNVTDGIVRMRYRNGEQPEYLQPDHPYEVTVDLWATSQVFLPGHCIRVDITGGSFPRWDRNPQSTDLPTQATILQAARHTILHDIDHPSAILLPIVAQ